MSLMGWLRRKFVVPGVILVVLVVGLVAFRSSQATNEYTAYFTQTKGIYVGDDITIQGVPVGTITRISPERDQVKVTLEVDSDFTLAADVRAAVVARSLVSVRAIALGPTYTGGPQLAPGDTIPLSRTTVPVEWDEVKKQLTDLTTALGPNGANKKGATSDLISSAAGFLDGQGRTINQTIGDLSEALSTLSDNGGELFATVRNLQVFTSALNGSDAAVRAFNQNLATVSGQLDADKGAIARALKGLSVAFKEVQVFLNKNTDLTVSTLRELKGTTKVFAKNRQKIADLLQVAPTAISNFYNIVDPRVSAATGILAFNNLAAPAQIICSALLDLGGTKEDCAAALGPLVGYLTDQVPAGVGPLPGGGSAPPSVPGTSPESNGIDSLLGGADLLGQLGLLGGGR
jgi:phospholipid/cholesterol/gamma-HCH transport system substrate-binding protein